MNPYTFQEMSFTNICITEKHLRDTGKKGGQGKVSMGTVDRVTGGSALGMEF